MIPSPVWQSRPGALMSSSEEMALRRVLLSPKSCRLFERFAALQGDFLDNDVRFWAEVQKYKVTSHGWQPNTSMVATTRIL